MSRVLITVAIAFLFFASSVRGDEVTPAMEKVFLDKLKSAVTHKDYKLFRSLFYESEDKGEWLKLQDFEPFDSLFSPTPRTYRFKPPTEMQFLDRMVLPTAMPIYHDAKWHEDLTIVRELRITFPMRHPDTSGNIATICLIAKDGRLWAVEGVLVMA